MPKKSTSEEFIARAKLVPQHQGKGYDYSRVKYKTNNTTVEIICPTHKAFWQTPSNHLIGNGCQTCTNKAVLTNKSVDAKLVGRPIQRISDIVGAKTKNWWQCLAKGCNHKWESTPNCILNTGGGCPRCGQNGFKSELPSVIYVYAINEEHCGYGISNNFVRRNEQHQHNFKKCGVVAELIATFECSGREAQRVELLLRRGFEVVNAGIDGFRREATHIHNLPRVLDFIETNLVM